MATLSDFLPHVLPYVPGCSNPLAEQHLRDICIDFCTHAPIVQELLDPINARAGVAEYDIDTRSGTQVTLILEASYLGLRLGALHSEALSRTTGAIPSGTPSAYMQAASSTLTLNAAPPHDAAQAIRLLVATRPKRTASNVDDVLLNDYGYQIGQGAVGRLLMIPGHPFSDPRNAFAYTANYSTARTEARIRAERSFGQTGLRVRPRPFQ